ncbi:Phage integrase, N-terminal SAM-like domain [Gracilibacillus ureilyticus]|uniref:Phage integrase, N-terminal SAM-like domain n=1 Tax=Gracilibacillus ureilyticus TaxID=531814 RepID=A0A1H9UCL1_9BACI|nr:site-specific integrase [Gracilibacillus ureilyticus]SES06884.1 Phage integrase, N-terminal SAM-like domain [Gracilibacillus ureilyticus]
MNKLRRVTVRRIILFLDGRVWKKYIDQFIRYLYEEAKDEKTIIAYRTSVAHFLKWKEERDGEYIIEETRPIDIKEYTSFLKHQCKRKPATISKYIAALKVFFGFLFDQGLVKDNPMTRIKIETLEYVISANETKWLTKE